MEQGRTVLNRVEPKGGQWIASIDVSEFLLVAVVVVCTLHFALQAVRRGCGKGKKSRGRGRNRKKERQWSFPN